MKNMMINQWYIRSSGKTHPFVHAVVGLDYVGEIVLSILSACQGGTSIAALSLTTFGLSTEGVS